MQIRHHSACSTLSFNSLPCSAYASNMPIMGHGMLPWAPPDTAALANKLQPPPPPPQRKGFIVRMHRNASLVVTLSASSSAFRHLIRIIEQVLKAWRPDAKPWGKCIYFNVCLNYFWAKRVGILVMTYSNFFSYSNGIWKIIPIELPSKQKGYKMSFCGKITTEFEFIERARLMK